MRPVTTTITSPAISVGAIDVSISHQNPPSSNPHHGPNPARSTQHHHSDTNNNNIQSPDSNNDHDSMLLVAGRNAPATRPASASGGNRSSSSSRRSPSSSSSFDVSLLPSLKMRRREMHSFSVHYSVATASWVATLARPDDTLGAMNDGENNNNNNHNNGLGTKRRCVSFQFPTEREARRFAKAYTPPKFQLDASACVCCSVPFVGNAANGPATSMADSPTSTSSSPLFASNNSNESYHHRTGISISIHSNSNSHHHHSHSNNTNNVSTTMTTTMMKGSVRSFHCKNCGSQICDKCSRRWSIRMIPKTYVSTVSSLTVRVCRSCDWLSNSFCMALLLGRSNDASALYDTGNVNLRSTFAHIHKEAMFPIHCAVMGGSLELVKWMVESHDVPLYVKKTKTGIPLSVQTSKSRTLIDLAMTGRPKIDVLGYLVSKNLSVMDCKDQTLAPKTLQTLLRAGYQSGTTLSSMRDVVDDLASLLSASSHESVASIDDACIICCEKTMDCVLTPCGHQICCSDCGCRLNQCPVCKSECSLVRIRKV